MSIFRLLCFGVALMCLHHFTRFPLFSGDWWAMVIGAATFYNAFVPDDRPERSR